MGSVLPLIKMRNNNNNRDNRDRDNKEKYFNIQ